MNASQLSIVATTPPFPGRVRHYLIKAAIAVMNESDTAPNHVARLAYAKKILSGAADLSIVASAVLTNETVAAYETEQNIPDGDIDYCVVTMFDALATANAA